MSGGISLKEKARLKSRAFFIGWKAEVLADEDLNFVGAGLACAAG